MRPKTAPSPESVVPAPSGDGVAATVWRRGEPPQQATLASRPLDEAEILWVELDLVPESDEGTLLEHLDGLTEEMLSELRAADRLSTHRTFDEGRIRLVSMCAMGCESRARGAEHGLSLFVEPVELLASSRWLVTCRHPARRIDHGGEAAVSVPAIAWDEIRASTARRWSNGSAASAGDLGILLMHELALTYGPCERELGALLEEWELRLYDGSTPSGEIAEQRRALRELWQLRAHMRDWIAPLNRVGIALDVNRAWLPCSDQAEAAAVDDRIDRVLRNLAELGVALRSSFHLLHLEEHERERERREEMQRRIEIIAAIFLIPTFIFGLYGANTWLPGQGKEWGFALMVAVMAIATVAGVVLLKRWHDEKRQRTSGQIADHPTSAVRQR